VPLGQGIGELWDALRDRVEVSGSGPEYQVTAGSFDTALAYARERFDEPVVLERQDRARWWPRVTLTVSTDPARAVAAPPLAELAAPVVPVQRRRHEPEPAVDGAGALPSSLEAIFAHQEEQREARRRRTDA
jgi:hypothetical protein